MQEWKVLLETAKVIATLSSLSSISIGRHSKIGYTLGSEDNSIVLTVHSTKLPVLFGVDVQR